MSWLLHHDNAPAHNSLKIREFLAKNNIAVLEQPPYNVYMPWEFRSFLPKITLLYWSNHPTPHLHPTLQIWPLVIFFCFPNSRKSSKELVFKTQKPLKQPWRESPERSRRNPSRSAWKRGRGDWKSASEPKEITLKTTCCKIYLSNKIKHL